MRYPILEFVAPPESAAPDKGGANLFNPMTYTIIVTSINKYDEVEWQETVTASCRSAVARLANKIARSCGIVPPVIDWHSKYFGSLVLK